MPVTSKPLGRRERNKQEKLDRITAAASELFAQYGVEEVTTQQIADKADIGTGTLFLYAKTKGELLLLVQNANYAAALERGRAAAEETPGVLDAVMSIVKPIVECNRTQVDNGRFYLREMVFGDPTEPHHSAALAIVGETEEAIATVFTRDGLADAQDAATTARVVSAVMFMTMAASDNTGIDIEALVQEIRTQIRLLIPR
ncbi:TetR/AcrR family transcriptional regulator [Paenarthrobacter sp. YJN-D]|uniref:TetR/AcrR family transcriptional regulator n=1 Tax=Paenarthrobacter sp. YJN-D TaxID=2735317 RepID=UPI0006F70750|nr:TetR/AcrR family transcriptional regulator [Paenarthrobacter sp. YJN-D]KQQ99171.1 TetR family transcriptional regulator [Arthrobacter sp. Leaf145]QOT20421.1 TetR/AcrR family transcriptional regulator [Paenarthrobacter sp. YJN-D]